jgi:hypothetical protein
MTTPSSASTTPDAIASKSRIAVVPYATLGAHLLSFLIGALGVLLAQNFAVAETTTFSTASLISFLFGIALSAASTVLAIAAISLGKTSEHAMIERSDASIRLQNEVFTKTTEALARIESSTGVTEKRIEDIISGRAGELSHAIAERLGATGTARGKSREMLEQEIRESLIGQLSESRVAQAREKVELQERIKEANKRYRAFQNDLLIGIASSQAGKCEKIGDGNFGAAGQELFDSVICIGSDRIGVSAFSVQPGLSSDHLRNFGLFLGAAVKEIASGSFHRVIVALDGSANPDGRYRKTMRETFAPMRPEIAERIELIEAPDGAAVQLVVDRLRILSASIAPPLLQIAPEAPRAAKLSPDEGAA